MPRKKYSNTKIDKNPEAFYKAVLSAFVKTGYRRTTMNDIAVATDMSILALYQIYKNKEDIWNTGMLFFVDRAYKKAISTLSKRGSILTRFTEALLDFEEIYYEPMAKSPYALELIDTSTRLDASASTLKKGRSDFKKALLKTLKEAENRREISFKDMSVKPVVFVHMLFTTLMALKYQDTLTKGTMDMSVKECRRRNSGIIEVFLRSIITPK